MALTGRKSPRRRRDLVGTVVATLVRMLRIDVTGGATPTLRVAGRLVGAEVEELDRAFRELAATHGAATIAVRLDAVTFVDAAGEALCRRLHAAGARLSASGCMTRAMVEAITRRGRPRRRGR